MAMTVNTYGIKEEKRLDFVVIMSRYQEKYLFVKHKLRDTLEIPGGKIERDESVLEAAKREIEEETGAIRYSLNELFVYGVEVGEKEDYGMVLYSEISELGGLPNSEIENVYLLDDLPPNLTYSLIQKKLFETFQHCFFL